MPYRGLIQAMSHAAILVSGTACSPGAQDGSKGEIDGDGDGDGDGDVACESKHEGMICIPAGPFIMGSNELGILEELEMPQQEVPMSQFHIDRHEVTFGEYRACVDAGACTPPVAENPDADYTDLTYRCRWGQTGIDEYPVACVDWLQAVAYCNWRGAALPTEAQWEKAGRGTDGRTYPWGNEPPSCEYASMADEFFQSGCGTGMPEQPGSHPRGDSPYGVQDMAGNVYELVADWLGPGQPNLGTDPIGPDSGEWKVRKGGKRFVLPVNWVIGEWLHLAWRGPDGLVPTRTRHRISLRHFRVAHPLHVSVRRARRISNAAMSANFAVVEQSMGD
jgi:sulfatase modifying factor 1